MFEKKSEGNKLLRRMFIEYDKKNYEFMLNLANKCVHLDDFIETLEKEIKRMEMELAE